LYGKVSCPLDSAERELGEAFTGAVGAAKPVLLLRGTGTPAMPERPRCFRQRTTARSFIHCAPGHHKSPRTDRVAWTFARSGERRRCASVHDGRPPAAHPVQEHEDARAASPASWSGSGSSSAALGPPSPARKPSAPAVEMCSCARCGSLAANPWRRATRSTEPRGGR